MQPGRPSLSADNVARRRAAHQLIDEPRVFEDPIALSILDPTAAAALRANPRKGSGFIGRFVRAAVVARSRFTEDALAAAVGRGVRQYVLLGAGLDTFAYRNPHRDLRVFEVDYPATQAWKRARLEQGGIAVPPSLTFVPVDFLTQTIEQELPRAGLRTDVPTFFSWLGVTMFLTPDAVRSTLGFIARGMPKGSTIVFDYIVPRSHLSLFRRWIFGWAARRAARGGEPFLGLFAPADLARDMRALGFSTVEDLAPEDVNARYFSGRGDGLRVAKGVTHLMKGEV